MHSIVRHCEKKRPCILQSAGNENDGKAIGAKKLIVGFGISSSGGGDARASFALSMLRRKERSPSRSRTVGLRGEGGFVTSGVHGTEAALAVNACPCLHMHARAYVHACVGEYYRMWAYASTRAAYAACPCVLELRRVHVLELMRFHVLLN
eukprot:4752815-Pleurochrysis_carterae.AAC.1